MKKNVLDSLRLLGTLLSRVSKAAEWSAGGKPQEAAKEVLSCLEKARKLVGAVRYEIGRSAATGILMVLNGIDKDFAYLKLELEYVDESQVSPETMKRVDQHAQWKIDGIRENFGEKLECCEKQILTTAKVEGSESAE